MAGQASGTRALKKEVRPQKTNCGIFLDPREAPSLPSDPLAKRVKGLLELRKSLGELAFLIYTRELIANCL